MTNSYGPKDPRRWIRKKTTELKDLVVDDITQEWQKIPEGARQSISKGAGEFAEDFGTAWEGTKRIDNKYDPREYAAAGTAYALEGIGAGFDWLTNQVAQKTGIDPAVVAVGEMFVPWSKLGKLGKVSKFANKTKNVQKLNNVSDLGFLKRVEQATGQTNLQTQAASFLNQIDNFDDILVKGSNSDLSYKRIAKDYRLASGAGLDLPVVEGYKAANPKTWNKYVLSETKHWAQHGKGSGKYFTLKHSTDPTQNIRYRLDNKGQKVIDGKTIDRSFSLKNLKHKKIENLTQQDRIQILRDTTLDSETVSAVMKLTPGGRIMHHAAPVKSTGKIREAFFKANPNLTQADWIPIQRRVEKELGIAFGDSPLNQRYPKTIAEHNDYHKLLRKYKVYATDYKFKKLTANETYIKLKELGNVVKKIDKEMGIAPTYTSKSIGKEFR